MKRAPCPKCGRKATLESGYGLMGGGCGAYEYCIAEGCNYFSKTPDPEADQEYVCSHQRTVDKP